MNDFNLEELRYLYDYVFRGFCSISLDKHEALKDKMRFKIDNYCREHKTHFDTTPCDCEIGTALIIRFITMTSCTECKQSIALELYKCPICLKVYK